MLVTYRAADGAAGAGFASVVLDVAFDLTLQPLAHLSSTDSLVGPPSLTPEGLFLDRGGESSDHVVPLLQSGEPNVTIYDLGGGAWQSIFQ